MDTDDVTQRCFLKQGYSTELIQKHNEEQNKTTFKRANDYPWTTES